MKIFRVGFYGFVLAGTLVIGLTTTATIQYLFSLLPVQAKAQDTPTQSLPPVAIAEEAVAIKDTIVESENVEMPNPEIWDPSDWYYLESEKVPKAFSDIDHVYLQTRETYEENGQFVDRPIVPKGFVLASNEFTFARIAVSNRELSFQTKTINGISYRFTGRFRSSALGDYCDTDVDQPDLEGKLIKIKDGKWAAEMNAQFYISCGC